MSTDAAEVETAGISKFAGVGSTSDSLEESEEDSSLELDSCADAAPLTIGATEGGCQDTKDAISLSS